jgi:hypothetical protein
MERTTIMHELAAVEVRIAEATSRAGQTTNDKNFEAIILEIRELRKKRAELTAWLESLGSEDG